MSDVRQSGAMPSTTTTGQGSTSISRKCGRRSSSRSTRRCFARGALERAAGRAQVPQKHISDAAVGADADSSGLEILCFEQVEDPPCQLLPIEAVRMPLIIRVVCQRG